MPDFEPRFVFLSSRLRSPKKKGGSKLVKLMLFALITKDKVRTLSADDSQHFCWYTDAAFLVHLDMRSHSSRTFSLSFGAMSPSLIKQKVSSRSSMEAELIAIDDKISKVTWSKRLTEDQGFKVNLNIVFQDNTSTIKLA